MSKNKNSLSYCLFLKKKIKNFDVFDKIYSNKLAADKFNEYQLRFL